MRKQTDHDLLPDLDPGDTLLVFPDVGREYRAEVRGIDHERERAKVHIPTVGVRWFDRDELEGFDARGDVLVNPDEPDHGGGDHSTRNLDGGRYGPHEQTQDARIARRRAARRF